MFWGLTWKSPRKCVVERLAFVFRLRTVGRAQVCMLKYRIYQHT